MAGLRALRLAVFASMRRRLGQRFLVAGLGGAVLGGAGVLSFGPIVRGEVRTAAEARGLEVSIGLAVPSLRGVSLRGVSVGLRSVRSLRIWCDEIFVPWGERIPSRLLGVRVVAVGDERTLRDEVVRWRQSSFPSQAAGGNGGVGTGAGSWPALEGVVIEWRRSPVDGDDVLHVSNASAVLSRDHLETSFESLRGRLGGWAINVDGASASAHLDGENWVADRVVVASVSASEVDHERVLVEASASEAIPDRTDPAVLGDGPGARMRAVNALARRVAEAASRRLGDNPAILLGNVRVRGRVLGEAVEAGPVSVRLSRDSGRLELALESRSRTASGSSGGLEHRPLALRVLVPFDPALLAPLRVEVAGGPITLAQLGLRDGDFGLSKVEQALLTSDAFLELDAAGRGLRVEGNGTLQGLSVRHARLAQGALEGLQIGWRGRFEARLDGTEVSVKEAEFDVGQLKLLVSGSYRRRDAVAASAGPWQHGASVTLDFEVPLTTCQSVFDSAPRALVPSLVGLTFAGSLSLKGHVRFDGSALSKTYDADWDGTQSCRILEVPNHLRVDRFRQPFEKVIYTPDGQEQKMTFGPGSPHWVSWASITKHMETAVLLSEDGRFRRHHGFDKEAIVNSLRDNLLAGAFRRGGSTISMQLAKNLFLSREKVLSRKLQEAVLTLYLEQELTKQEILELYFNIIEYGPLVYGIGPAAKYHFGTTPNDLSLAQALYLGSILQNPKKQFYGADGEVSPARMDYLHKLMKTAAKLHLISAAELADGLQEKLYFGRPAIPPEQPAPLEATVAPTEESPSP